VVVARMISFGPVNGATVSVTTAAETVVSVAVGAAVAWGAQAETNKQKTTNRENTDVFLFIDPLSVLLYAYNNTLYLDINTLYLDIKIYF
jgi:hypothetical protein